MDLFDGIRSAFRRWYVLLVVLILTAIVAVIVNQRKTTEYTSSATVGITTVASSVLTPTSAATAGAQRNNALLTNGGINLVTNLLSITLQNSSIRTIVAAAGGTLDYTVDIASNGQAGQQLPILNVSAKGPRAAEVATTMRVLTAQSDSALASVQRNAGVSADKFARTFLIRPTSVPQRITLSVARNVGIVIVAGVLVGLVLAASVDNLITRRKHRPKREAVAEPSHALE